MQIEIPEVWTSETFFEGESEAPYSQWKTEVRFKGHPVFTRITEGVSADDAAWEAEKGFASRLARLLRSAP